MTQDRGYPRDEVCIEFDRQDYENFEKWITGNHGVSFSELASSDPREAYQRIDRVFQYSSNNVETSTRVGANELTVDMDGKEAASNAAKNALRVLDLDADIKPIDVTVLVFKKPTLMDKIRNKKPIASVVVAFSVEPPNLAF